MPIKPSAAPRRTPEPPKPRARSARRVERPKEASLRERVLRIADEHGCDDVAVSFHDYESRVGWGYNADAWFHAASTMKMAVLLAVFRQVARGDLRLDADVAVRNRFLSIVDAKPYRLRINTEGDSLVHRRVGRTMTLHELCWQMITCSSNLATNLLVDVVGIPRIAGTLRDVGVRGVRVLRGVEDQPAFEAGLNNEVTANGLCELFRAVFEERAAPPDLTARMLDILFAQQFDSGIPALLPDAARVAHKTGNIATVHHDCGLVYLPDRQPYVVVVLTRFRPENDRGSAVAELSLSVFDALVAPARKESR